MTSQLHAAHFADRACQERVSVAQNVHIVRDTYRLRFHCPSIARVIVPGQFVMLRLADSDDPLLARPLALYDTVLADGDTGPAVGIDVVYLVQGKMTSRLAQCPPGQALDVWGPLGNSFLEKGSEAFSNDNSSDPILLMVAGGIGQTPFMALAREQLGLRQYGDAARVVTPFGRVILCYGARGKDYLAGVADFERLGVEVRISTDDGSAGHHGLVTQVLEQVLDESPHCHVVCCGPEPMMERVAEITSERSIPCQVSLETPMACGIGICFSCVTRVREKEGGWDYRRTCVEGPVFDAARIVW